VSVRLRQATALLVSPILPASGGNGLALRAGVFLEALAADHEVTLLLVPLAGGGGETPDFVRQRTARVALLSLEGTLDPLYALSAGVGDPAARLAALRAYPRPSLCRWATTPTLARAADAVGAVSAHPFDTVVVLRSYLAPYAAPFLAEGSFRVLDLDDDERLTQSRLSELYERRGRPEEALLAAAEAGKYAAHERVWLPRFDLALAASELHAAAVRARDDGGGPVRVMPNTVEVPDEVRRAPHSSTLRLLFVGNLGYEPNVDAALWLAKEIVPCLRALRQRGGAVELRIAGSRPAAEVTALAGAGVEVCADPPDLAPHYAWADVALAPIRTGGGTRIKILEAFAARVPVVATGIGAEGLAVNDGEHLLLADDTAGIAAACRRLADHPALAGRLTANALARVRERYSRPEGVQHLRTLLTRA
jgi:glycosyltransferase involved in cell wall biosynthesis